ncbi:MAG: response regulator [Deltaproteobacteria bacterium]|nr:response regulator [Deltaproteobacteria bacterium]
MRKVLVVEDSSAMRGLIASIVDQVDDCEVVEVAGGFDALRQLPRERFALIITDINMPDINGLELLSFIRKNPNYTQTPVLIVSTESSERDRAKGLALGANAYITKPFIPDDLKAAVLRLLGSAT